MALSILQSPIRKIAPPISPQTASRSILAFNLETLDFHLRHTTSFEKESLPLRDLRAAFGHIFLEFLGCCNGLVASLDSRPSKPQQPQESLFIWKTSTADRGHISQEFIFGSISGFGYVSTSDEYKLVMDGEIYSFTTKSWKPIEMTGGCVGRVGLSCGVLFHDQLHWLVYPDFERQQVQNLYAFDLEKEEFSMMKLPSALHKLDRRNCLISQVGVTREGCLYVMADTLVRGCDDELGYYVVDFWVMREYCNSDSWTRLLGVKIPAPRDRLLLLEAISVLETSAFVRRTCPVEEEELMSTTCYRNEEDNSVIYMTENYARAMVVYEKSLCCLD